MNAQTERVSSLNENPVIIVKTDGTLLYSNAASEPLLHEWCNGSRDKLTSNIGEIIQKVISKNSPEKMEVKAGNKVYLVVLHPAPEQESVHISGFEISDHRELRDEIQQSEERLKALMDHNPSLIFMKDECGRYVYLNKSYEVQFINSKDWYGKTDFDFWPKESAELFRANDSLVLESGYVQQFMEDSTDLNGTRYCWLNYKFPFTDSKNNKYVGGIGINATDRVCAEEALKESEEALKEAYENLEEKIKERTVELKKAYELLKESEGRLRALFNILPVGVSVTDNGRNVIDANSTLERILDLSRSDLLDGKYETRKYIKVDGTEMPPYEFPSVKALREKGSIQSSEFGIIKEDGSIIWIDVSATALPFSNGQVVIATRDITERKKAEERIKHSEEKYRNIVETTNEGISIVDTEARVTYANKKVEDMLGYSSEELIGRPIWDFISDESKTAAKLNFENRMKGIEESLEVKLTNKNGSYFWVCVNTKSIFNNNGEFVGSLNMLSDITKRKEAEEAVKCLEKSRKKEIHHRIKNNLQVISSLLDLQVDKIKHKKNITKSEVLEAFKESQDRVLSMALIHEELHRGEDIDKLNFSSYIEELADNLFLTYGLGNESIKFDKNIEEDIYFNIDVSVPLGLILNELISNSFKYAFPSNCNGEIRVTLCREETGICDSRNLNTVYILSVSDNGIGIPEDIDIENLFSLGLQLVTTLVEQLDGELELKSNNGTEFIIRFTVTEKDKHSS